MFLKQKLKFRNTTNRKEETMLNCIKMSLHVEAAKIMKAILKNVSIGLNHF